MKKSISESERELLEATGARLAIERAERSLTLKEMGKKLGVSQRTYQTYEQGERQMSIFAINAAKRNLDIDPTWLITGEPANIENHDFEELENISTILYDYVLETNYTVTGAQFGAILSKAYSKLISREKVTMSDLATWVSFIGKL